MRPKIGTPSTSLGRARDDTSQVSRRETPRGQPAEHLPLSTMNLSPSRLCRPARHLTWLGLSTGPRIHFSARSIVDRAPRDTPRFYTATLSHRLFEPGWAWPATPEGSGLRDSLTGRNISCGGIKQGSHYIWFIVRRIEHASRRLASVELTTIFDESDRERLDDAEQRQGWTNR